MDLILTTITSDEVFIWRGGSPIGRAGPHCRDLASQLNSLSKFVFVYMRGGPARYRLPRSRLGGLEIFHINASQSSVHTHDKVCLGQHFLDNFLFHKFCLFMCRI